MPVRIEEPPPSPSKRGGVGRVNITLISATVSVDSVFNPNPYVVIYKSLREGMFVTRLGQSEVEFGSSRVTFQDPYNSFQFDDVPWDDKTMVQRDELEIILEVWSFGMLSGSTFLGQVTLNQTEIARLIGRGESELPLTAKPQSEQLEAEVAGGALCGALPASGAPPGALDDVSQPLEDAPDVRQIEKGRITIELKTLTSKRTLLSQQPHQSMFNIMRHAMESAEQDIIHAASEAISPTHESNAGGGGVSDRPALNGNATDPAGAAPEAAAQNGAAPRPPGSALRRASERLSSVFSRGGNDDEDSASGSRRNRRRAKANKPKKIRFNIGSSSRSKSQPSQR